MNYNLLAGIILSLLIVIYLASNNLIPWGKLQRGERCAACGNRSKNPTPISLDITLSEYDGTEVLIPVTLPICLTCFRG